MNPTTPSEVTFASFLTPEGMMFAASIVTALIEIGKKVLPRLYKHINGMQQSFILTGTLYVLTAIVVPWDSPDDLLRVFMAWLGTTGITVAAYEVVVDQILNHETPKKIKKRKVRPIIGRNEKFDDD